MWGLRQRQEHVQGKIRMAETGDRNAEFQAHEQTWHGFTAMMKWGTLGVAIIAAFVVFLIAS